MFVILRKFRLHSYKSYTKCEFKLRQLFKLLRLQHSYFLISKFTVFTWPNIRVILEVKTLCYWMAKNQFYRRFMFVDDQKKFTNNDIHRNNEQARNT